MAADPETKRTRAEQKARRPQEILDAAFEEFVARGFAATRVEDIASRVGVTKGTVYLYFPTKEVLFEETMRHTSAPLADLQAFIDTAEGTCRVRMHALLCLAYEKVADDRKTREQMRLAVAEGARFPGIIDRHYAEFVAPLINAIRMLLDEGIKSGEFRQGAASRQPDLVVGPLIHVIFWRLLFANRKAIDMTEYIDGHWDLIMNGLGARD
ncbi:MAG TPA: TetR/AcrR family transcriptional regulator [Paenirhodobacter sp.]